MYVFLNQTSHLKSFSLNQIRYFTRVYLEFFMCISLVVMKAHGIFSSWLGLKRIDKYSLFDGLRRKQTRASAKQKMESAIPPEFRFGHHRIPLSLIDPNKKKDDDEYNWINEIFENKDLYSYFLEFITTKHKFSNKEAHSILSQSIYHTIRAADWADDNEVNSGDAARAMLSSMFFGVGKAVLSNFDSIYDYVKNIFGFLSNISSAFRGYKQFKIYGERIDEDRAENNYEGEKYRNKASSLFADLAYLFETKINPLVLPVLGFCSERIQDSLKPLLSLCNILWWRIRMPVEINQSFATDVLNFMIHKPLSLAGFERSTEILKTVDPDNVSYDYINKRARALIGLDPNKDKSVSILKKLFIEFKSLFSEDIEKQIKSSIKINKFISPFLGFYGFFAALIGMPLSSIFRFFNKENKFVEAFTQTSFASQQMIYLFRLMLPEYWENKKLELKDIKKLKENPSYKLDKNVIELREARKKTFYTAATVCLMNFASIFLKFFNFENRFLNTGVKIYNEIADKGIPYYLSKRRELLGKKFKLDNSELFTETWDPKIDFKEFELNQGVLCSA